MTKLHLSWLKLKNNFPTILITVFLFSVGLALYANLGRDDNFDWDEGFFGENGRQVV
jgi:hypothetical protein